MARILIVDDDELIAGLIMQALERAGHAVDVVSDGLAAEAVLVDDEIDTVVTDVFMPKCDGLELIKKIRRKWPEMPILAISGGGDCGFDSILSMATLLGATATLRKPFHLCDLVDAVARLEKGRRRRADGRAASAA